MIITQQAIEKLTNKGTWIFIPSTLSNTSLPMADLLSEDENGNAIYHSLTTLIESAKSYGLKLVPDTFMFNGIEYTAIRYAMYMKDISLLKTELTNLGLNVLDTDNNFAYDLPFDTFTGNEVFICSHIEKGKIDDIFKVVSNA